MGIIFTYLGLRTVIWLKTVFHRVKLFLKLTEVHLMRHLIFEPENAMDFEQALAKSRLDVDYHQQLITLKKVKP